MIYIVLDSFVEAVHLVHEDDGAPALGRRDLGALDRLADLLHAAQHRGDADELRIESLGQQPCQRGLAHARRPPQDHGMQASGLEGHAQGHALAQQLALADDFVQMARPQALRQGLVGLAGRGRRPRGLRCLGRRLVAEQGSVLRHAAASAPPSLLQQVHALGDLEAEALGTDRHIGLQLAQLHQGALAEGVQHLQRDQLAALEADAQLLDVAVRLARQGQDPVHAGLTGLSLELEVLLDVAPRQQRRRRAGQGLADAAGAGLVEVRVEGPDLLAIPHDQLLEGLLVLEAEQVRALEFEGAAGGLLALAVWCGDGLAEAGAAALDLAHEVLERLGGVGLGKT